jgi:N-acetylneuraminic acid mutarotase
LPDGRVLAAGGGNPPPTTAEIYDPNTGIWTPTGSMNDARSQGHAAVLLKNGKVLVVGGPGLAHGEWLSSAELYDPVTGSWTRTGSLFTGRYWTSAVLLNDGRAMVFGGHTADSDDVDQSFRSHADQIGAKRRRALSV